MIQRSELNKDHKRFRPLYRSRNYEESEMIVLMYLEASTWFTGERIGDPYKDEWKKKITRKGVGKGRNTVWENLEAFRFQKSKAEFSLWGKSRQLSSF